MKNEWKDVEALSLRDAQLLFDDGIIKKALEEPNFCAKDIEKSALFGIKRCNEEIHDCNVRIRNALRTKSALEKVLKIADAQLGEERHVDTEEEADYRKRCLKEI